MLDRLPYREIWAVCFEFQANPGERPDPFCLVAMELRSGQKLRLWEDQFRHLPHPPFAIDDDSLFVSSPPRLSSGAFERLGGECRGAFSTSMSNIEIRRTPFS